MGKVQYLSARQSVLRACGSVLMAAGFIASAHVFAGAANWSSTNIQYLKGNSYENVGTGEESSASIITLEHVNGWKYGDNFFFVDITNPDNGHGDFATSFYGEISPRFSLSSISGKSLSFGIVKDVLITTTMEVGQGFHNNLYGLAVDFAIPKVPVAQINYYIRNEIGVNKDTGSQLTLVWLAPFSIGSASMTFEGFFDYVFGMDHAENNIVAGPRLLLDVGKLLQAPGTLQVGIEYQLWRNKYGIDGIDEDAPQAMVKWIW